MSKILSTRFEVATNKFHQPQVAEFSSAKLELNNDVQDHSGSTVRKRSPWSGFDKYMSNGEGETRSSRRQHWRLRMNFKRIAPRVFRRVYLRAFHELGKVPVINPESSNPKLSAVSLMEEESKARYIEGPSHPEHVSVQSLLKKMRNARERKASPVGILKKASQIRANLISRLDNLSDSPDLCKKVEESLEIQNKILWTAFQDLLLTDQKIVRAAYNKSVMDSALEDCFGSLEKPGNGIFQYERVKFSIKDHVDASRAFSLYLGRKCFVTPKQENIAKANKSFLERVYSDIPTRDEKKLKNIRNLFSKITRALFTKEALTTFKKKGVKEPTHGSASVEVPKAMGGKRSLYYQEEASFKKREVRPQTILCGGKLRTITVDSAYNMKYAYLNKFMASEIRKCKWSVFGQTVEEWLEKNPTFLNSHFYEEYVSGDLESATDLFDGWFAESVIKHLCEIDDTLTREDAEQMMRFTTRAELIEGKIQKRGQLMGSILSFPILCLVSFTAYLFETKEGEEFLKMGHQGARKYIHNIDNVGVNGDDVVFKTDDKGKRWEANVKLVGGKVSRGKTLLSRETFTVNSELWFNHNGWKRPCAIRPTLVLSISDGRSSNPQKLWKEYAESPLISQSKKALFQVGSQLLANIPRRYGGLGEVIFFDVQTWLKKKNEKINFSKKEVIRPSTKWSQSDKDDLIRLGKNCQTYLVNRSDRKDIRDFYFGKFDRIPSWTEKEKKQKKYDFPEPDITFMTAEEIEHERSLYLQEMQIDQMNLVRMRVPEPKICPYDIYVLPIEKKFEGSRMRDFESPRTSNELPKERRRLQRSTTSRTVPPSLFIKPVQRFINVAGEKMISGFYPRTMMDNDLVSILKFEQKCKDLPFDIKDLIIKEL